MVGQVCEAERSMPGASERIWGYKLLRVSQNVRPKRSAMRIPLNWFQTTFYKWVLVNITKRMEKAPILRYTFLHQYLYFLTSHYTQRPFKNSVDYFFLIPMLMDKRAPPFCQLFWFCSKPNIFIYLCRDLFFCPVLVHTRVRQVKNQYIIIYNMKKHHFTWT